MQYFRHGDRDVQRAPLAKRLLRIEGVESVFLGRDFITVSKGGDIIWQVRPSLRSQGTNISHAREPIPFHLPDQGIHPVLLVMA